MKAMAEYAMRGRVQIASLASLFAVLSLILPPLSYISGALVALVTLRKGVAEGAIIALIAAVVLSIVAKITAGTVVIGAVFTLMVWLPVWLLALILRRSVSLSIAMAAAALMSGLAVLLFHLAVGDPVIWWLSMLDTLFDEAFKQSGADMSQLEMMRQNMAEYMTGMMATAFFLSMMLSLFLGRWWQALLYNPGGFQSEFYVLRLDKTVSLVAMLILVWALVSATAGSLAANLAFIVVTFGSIAGLSLVHQIISIKKINKAWLIALYLILAFIAPQLLIVLAMIGFTDAWLDIRRYYQNQTV